MASLSSPFLSCPSDRALRRRLRGVRLQRVLRDGHCPFWNRRSRKWAHRHFQQLVLGKHGSRAPGDERSFVGDADNAGPTVDQRGDQLGRRLRWKLVGLR